MHNAERTLRRAVIGMLDLAEIMARRIQVAIVDDGSTDGTFEAASELAREFPQVRVLRQPLQRGLGGALELARTRLGVDQAIAHDGLTPVDLEELARLLAAPAQRASAAEPLPMASGRGSRRSSLPTPVRATALRGEKLGPSFRWLRLDEPAIPRRQRSSALPLGVLAQGLTSPEGQAASPPSAGLATRL
jgi:hypothetical protein